MAFTQMLWQILQSSKHGLSLSAIDSLFAVIETPALLWCWELWSSALPLMPIVSAIWLMPMVSVVVPSALTINPRHIATSKPGCRVPSLDWTSQVGLPLSNHDYEGVYLGPSATVDQIVQVTAQSGQQQTWQSPCGPNCSYEVQFQAPVWSCPRFFNLDTEASWSPPEVFYMWYGGYGNGSNYTVESMQGELEYSPIYQGEFDNQTSLFWIGATDSVSLEGTPASMSVEHFLDLHIYGCHFAQATYHLRVSYINDHQSNELLGLDLHQNLTLPNDGPGELESVDQYMDDVKSMYTPLMNLISGFIDRDPRAGLDTSTELASIPGLCKKYTGPIRDTTTDSFIPELNLGPLLEGVSHNISISLLSQSDPRLRGVVTVETTCQVYHTETVWKYTKWLLLLPYLLAIAVTLLSFIIAAKAIRSAGAVRDKSFSTIIRSTRTRELDSLDAAQGESHIASLPLPTSARKQRLVFAGHDDPRTSSTSLCEKRMSFRLVESLDSP